MEYISAELTNCAIFDAQKRLRTSKTKWRLAKYLHCGPALTAALVSNLCSPGICIGFPILIVTWLTLVVLCTSGYWTQSRLGRVRSCLSAEYKLMMSRRGLDSRPVLLDDVEIEKNLGDVLPIIESILKTLKAIHGKIETVRENKEEIRLLADRCDYLAISAILQCKVDPSVRDLKYLNCGVFDLDQLVDKCNELRRFDWDEMGKLEGRIDGLIQDASLDGVAALRCDLHELKGTLVIPWRRLLVRRTKSLDYPVV